MPFKWEPCLWTNTLGVVKKLRYNCCCRRCYVWCLITNDALLQFNAVCVCTLSNSVRHMQISKSQAEWLVSTSSVCAEAAWLFQGDLRRLLLSRPIMQCEHKKERKEKSTPLGVITGASVPRSSPRLGTGPQEKAKSNAGSPKSRLPWSWFSCTHLLKSLQNESYSSTISRDTGTLHRHPSQLLC